MKPFENDKTTKDFLASIVVFLVALPLCMGIAVASGVPASYGLITGIIGGIVVGFVSGSPLQVSGPAAGLSVLVWDLVTRFGIEKLGIIVTLAGLIQIISSLMGLGLWFRAVSPAVIHGMLAGIGALIIASQTHILMDLKPLGSGIHNFKEIIPRFLDLVSNGQVQNLSAVALGLTTILIIVGWNKYRPIKMKAVPAALISVILVSFFAYVTSVKVQLVSIPTDFLSNIKFQNPLALFSGVEISTILVPALALAFIASAESLLCASAVDQMTPLSKTNYNRELGAQGIGNFICGLLGALPMTGVIVRSAANVESGAKTRTSAILHGVWILVFVAVFPNVLGLIPLTVLAGILVFTGFKLLNFSVVRELRKHGWSEVAIFGLTAVGIVLTDLLTGVLLGLFFSTLKVIKKLRSLKTEIEEKNDETVIKLEGQATFFHIPKLAKTYGQHFEKKPIVVNVSKLKSIDHACHNLFKTWENSKTRIVR
jgi:MFS superfamily sulfate permease-like transporter